MDSTVVGTITPFSSTFAPFGTGSLTKTPGYHTLGFVGTGNTADIEYSFIDSVNIAPAPPN
jgi:hypothetical protein